ncbi:MAG TPA: 30S ribosomal protein S17 [Candidatus Omnitrophica bacterium]|nr:30S ribosomal protein S17 [Candidatus Omnitrophota bacterium]
MSSQEPLKTGKRKEFVGNVVSDKMQKTIVVEVNRLVSHSKYGKTIKSKARFKAHDEKNEAHVGDKVRICETRPLSKDKRWRLAEIISKANIVESSNDL